MMRDRARDRPLFSPPRVDYTSFPDLPAPQDVGGTALRRARFTIFWVLLRRQWMWLALFVVTIALSAGGQVAVAATLRALIDEGIVEQSSELAELFRNAVIAAIYTAAMVFCFQRVLARLVYQLDFDLRVWLFTRLQTAEVRRLDTVTSGQIISRALTDVTLIEQAMQLVLYAFVGVPAILGLTLYLLSQNLLVGLLAAAALPGNLWLLNRFRHRLRALSWAEVNERAEAAAAINEPVRGMRVVQAFDRAEDERSKVADVVLRVFRLAMARVRLLARFDVFLKAAPVLANALLLGVGISLTAAGELTLGTLLLAFQLVQITTLFAQGLDLVASAWQYLVAAQGRIAELLVLGVPPRAASSSLGDSEKDGAGVEFEDVSVELGGRQVLDSFDLSVAPGMLAVLRGAPGSGKSTIAAIMAGVLTPDEGSVRVAGVDIGLLSVAESRQAVQVAPEVPFFFSGTLRDNLELVHGNAVPADELLAALWAAGAEDVLDALPGGLEGTVGDRGLTLSGGQRQRVALARTLIEPPRVLVLDDALSAVNPARELEILQRIQQHAPATAIVCITRRSGPTTIADVVIDLPAPDSSAGAADTAEPMALGEFAGGALSARHLDILERLEPSDEAPAYPPELGTGDQGLRVGTITTPYKGLIAVAVVALGCMTVMSLAPNFIIGDAADTVRRTDATRQGWLRAGLMVMAGAGLGGAAWWFRVTAARYAQSVVYLLRRRVFHRLSRLGIDYYDREPPGQTAARVVYDLDVLTQFLERTGFNAVVLGAQVVLSFAALSVLHPPLIPLLGTTLAIIALVSIYFVPRIDAAMGRQRERVGDVSTRFEEDFAGRRDVRYLGAGEQRVRIFVDTAWELRRAMRRVADLHLVFGAILSAFSTTLAAAVLFQAGHAVVAVQLSVGAALTLNLLAQQVVTPLQAFPNLYTQFLKAAVSWRQLNRPFEEPILPATDRQPTPVDRLDGHIRFENVAFTYPNTQNPVLHDIAFDIEPGSTVAIVGYTGAGKSSITKLLLRTYDPDRGSLCVDGRDLRRLDLGPYRRRIGVVPQDAFLFKGTVHSNIAYGRPQATSAEVEQAASAVGAHEAFAALAEGYEHPVHEEGRNLTNAQQQLVALARAWLTRPDVMILDEATSALDPGLERAVLDAISRLDCTTLMVTHRESVVVTAERIIVLDSGRIVEDGTPDQVIGAGGPYDQLWVLRPDQQRQMIEQAIDTQLLDDTESARDASGAAGAEIAISATLGDASDPDR